MSSLTTSPAVSALNPNAPEFRRPEPFHPPPHTFPPSCPPHPLFYSAPIWPYFLLDPESYSPHHPYHYANYAANSLVQFAANPDADCTETFYDAIQDLITPNPDSKYTATLYGNPQNQFALNPDADYTDVYDTNQDLIAANPDANYTANLYGDPQNLFAANYIEVFDATQNLIVANPAANYTANLYGDPQNQISAYVGANYIEVYDATQNLIAANSATNYTAIIYGAQPPPLLEVLMNNGQPGRIQRRIFQGDQRGRGRANSSPSVKPEENGRNSSWGEGHRRDDRVAQRGTQREGPRHAVMPLKRDGQHTTVMIKNVPYDFLRGQLIDLLDEFCSRENAKTVADGEGSSRNPGERVISAYDFFYLPVDFKTELGKGYAFVNFTHTSTVWKFYEAYNLKTWNFVPLDNSSSKRIEVVCAKIQGKNELERHFSQSVFECEKEEYLPVSFSPARDGIRRRVEPMVVGRLRGRVDHNAQPENNNHEPGALNNEFVPVERLPA